MNKFLINTNLFFSFSILASCVNLAHGLSIVGGVYDENDGKDNGKLNQEQIRALGVEVNWLDSEQTEAVSISINSNMFLKCSAKDYINYVIWDNDGGLVYRERIMVDRDIEKNFFMETEVLEKYEYYVYIGGAKAEDITEGDDVCSVLRRTGSSIRIEDRKN